MTRVDSLMVKHLTQLGDQGSTPCHTRCLWLLGTRSLDGPDRSHVTFSTLKRSVHMNKIQKDQKLRQIPQSVAEVATYDQAVTAKVSFNQAMKIAKPPVKDTVVKIRARKSGVFHVITYEPLPESEKVK